MAALPLLMPLPAWLLNASVLAADVLCFSPLALAGAADEYAGVPAQSGGAEMVSSMSLQRKLAGAVLER